MTDKKIVIGDEMIRVQLTENSSKLHISIADLINQYVCRGLYRDDYYEPPKYTWEELMEMGKKAVEKDIQNGIPLKKHNFDVFVGRWNK